MTLRITRSWENDDQVVAPLAQTFRGCPEQFRVLESFVLDRLAPWTPPVRRRERLAFVAERCPQLSRQVLLDQPCREALQALVRQSLSARSDESGSGQPPPTLEAMVACAVSLVLSRWMSSPEANRARL